MNVRHPQFKVRTWLQLTMLPALTVISVMIGVGLIFELRRLILAGFNQELQGVSAVIAAFVDPVDHAWLMEAPPEGAGPEWLEAREASPAYQTEVVPLRRTRDRLGLTYVYTQVVSDGQQIRYGLDGTTGEEHSPLQTADELPAEEVEGVTRLIETGQPHFTRLRKWEQWGLIKSAFVPIFDAEGKVVAMAGTDVNVSVIEARTRNALLMVFFIGAITLFCASAWSWRIARVLRRPVEDLKTGALRVASGDYQELRIEQPEELHRLADDFNRVSREVKRTAEHLTAETARIVREQNEREIRHRLARAAGGAPALAAWAGVEVDAKGEGTDALVVGDRAVLWWFRAAAMPAADAWRERSDVARRVEVRLRGTAPANEPELWPAELAAVVVLDRTRRTWSAAFVSPAAAADEAWKMEVQAGGACFSGSPVVWTVRLQGYANPEGTS